MKKVALCLLLTCVAVVLYVSFQTLSSPWSVISKVILLTLFSCACLSAGLLATRAWLDTLSTTSLRDGSNRLATLAEAEKRIALGKTMTSDEQIHEWLDIWEELNEKEQELYDKKT